MKNIKYIIFIVFILSINAFGFDLFDMIDPEGKSEKLQRAKNILKGAGDIVSSGSELDYKTEFQMGESLALEGFKRYGMPVKSDKIQNYVNILGNALSRNSTRPGIDYYFVVVDSDLYNAFSCPGGIIFISSALIKIMNNESELAGVLAHEIAHVACKHALQSLKRSKLIEGVGTIATANSNDEKRQKYMNRIGNLQNILFDKGLDKNMEYEADLNAIKTLYKTGYDPEGLVNVLNKLQNKQNYNNQPGSWFSTHPPLKYRINRCYDEIIKYPDRSEMAKNKSRFMKYKKLL